MHFEKDMSEVTEQESKQHWKRFHENERQKKELEIELVDFLNTKDVSYSVAVNALDDVIGMLRHQAFSNKI